jgi:hypothetical protein
MSDMVREIIGIVGAVAVTFGVYQLNHPAGWIVGGLLSIAWAFLDDWLD